MGANMDSKKALMYLLSYLEKEMFEKRTGGAEKVKHPSVSHYLQSQYPKPEDKASFADKLRDLERRVALKLRARADNCLVKVPDVPAAAVSVPAVPAEEADQLAEPEQPEQSVTRFRVRLWHFSFGEDASMRGAAPTSNVLKNLQRFVVLGNPTHLYPVEAFFDKLGLSVGDAILDYKVGISIGMSVVSACYLIGHCLLKVRQWPGLEGEENAEGAVLHALGRNLLSIFRLTVVDAGSNLTVVDKIQNSLFKKIAASNRTRPTPLEMYRALNCRVFELQSLNALRGEDEIWSEVTAVFNGRQVGQQYQLYHEEILAIKLLAKVDEPLRAKLQARHLSRWFPSAQTRTLLLTSLTSLVTLPGSLFKRYSNTLPQAVWGNAKLNETAVPLKLLASDFLQPTYPLPVVGSNRFWASALAWSIPKMHMWLDRTSGRFDAKCAQVRAAGRQPSLKNNAHMYRDRPEDWEFVARSSFLFETLQPQIKSVYQVGNCNECKLEQCQKCQQYQDLMDRFCRGNLDSQLLEKCKTMDSTLDPMQLRFLLDQAHSIMADWQPDALANQLDQHQAAQREADFKLMETQMLTEEMSFMDFIKLLTEYMDTNQLELTEARERSALQRKDAVANFLESHVQLAALPERSNFADHIQHLFRQFCESPPFKSPDSVLRINVVSMPSLGVAHSLHTDQYVGLAASECTSFPKGTVYLVILPNTPKFGSSIEPGRRDAYHDLVMEAQVTVTEKFQQKVGLKCKVITGQLSKEHVRSKLRELRMDMLMVVSNQCDSEGEMISVWRKSEFWQRRTVATALKPLDRSMFRTWGTNSLIEARHRDWTVEYRHHFTGQEFWDSLIIDLCSNSLACPSMHAHVRDLSLYDPELAMAVVNLVIRNGPYPKFSYCGLTHQHFLSSGQGKRIVDHCEERIHNHTLSQVETGTFLLPGCSPLATSAATAVPAVPGEAAPGAGAPKLDTVFEVCAQSGRLLPIRQSVHDRWSNTPSHKERFEALAYAHNVTKGFNPSCTPFKLTRPAPDSLEQLEQATAAVTVPAVPGVPETVTALENAFSDVLKSFQVTPSLTIFVAADHSAYLANTSDIEIVVDRNEPLLKIKA